MYKKGLELTRKENKEREQLAKSQAEKSESVKVEAESCANIPERGEYNALEQDTQKDGGERRMGACELFRYQLGITIYYTLE